MRKTRFKHMSCLARKTVFWVSDQFRHKLSCTAKKMVHCLNFLKEVEWDCTINIAKTKALISCAVTVQLICPLIFAYAKCRF